MVLPPRDCVILKAVIPVLGKVCDILIAKVGPETLKGKIGQAQNGQITFDCSLVELFTLDNITAVVLVNLTPRNQIRGALTIWSCCG